MLGFMKQEKVPKAVEDRVMTTLDSVLARGAMLEEGLQYHQFLTAYRPFKDIGVVYEKDSPLTPEYASALGLMLLGFAEINPHQSDDLEGIVNMARSCFMGGMCTYTRKTIEGAGIDPDNFESFLKLYDEHEALCAIEPEKFAPIIEALGLYDRYKKASEAWEEYLANRAIARNLLLTALKRHDS